MMTSTEYTDRMPRWESGSQDRMAEAALTLFEEQGFEQTHTTEIAQRARVTTRTFFRYFIDKREVLFAESDEVQRLLAEAVLRIPDLEDPLQVVLDVLSGYDWETLGSRAVLQRRQLVIAANPELLERDLLKQDAIETALAEALRQRGIAPTTAKIAAAVGISIFREAYEHWLRLGAHQSLEEICASTRDSFAEIVHAWHPVEAR
jgi:AcrR family transcriptional regulator